MNLLYLRAKLFGRPFRNEDGDGEAGGSMGVGADWGGPSPGLGNGSDLSPSTSVSLTDAETAAATAEQQGQSNANNVGGWSGGLSNDGFEYGFDGFAEPSAPSSPTSLPAQPAPTVESKVNAEDEKEKDEDSTSKSIAKAMVSPEEDGVTQAQLDAIAASVSGPAAGTAGKGKAGETAVGGWGDVSGKNSSKTEATAEVMGRTMSPESARSQLEASGMSSNSRGMSAKGFSTTGISEAALSGLSKAGLGGMDLGPNQPAGSGQTVDHALASINFADNVAPVLAGLITSAVPGAGMLMTAAKTIDQGMKTGNWGKAFTDSLFGIAANKATGMINREVFSALGPIGKAMVDYNSISPIGRAFGLDTPGINPAGLIGSAIGINNPSGGSQGMYGGYAPSLGLSGTDSTGSSAPVTAPIQTTSTPQADEAIDYGTRINGAALGKAIREGAATRYRR